MIDELKEFNLEAKEKPHSIYVSLISKQEEEYFKILSECMDVFVWNYKEMLGLDPKVVVHNLPIRKGESPKKQPQQFFHPKLILEIEKEVNKLINAMFIHEVNYQTCITTSQ